MKTSVKRLLVGCALVAIVLITSAIVHRMAEGMEYITDFQYLTSFEMTEHHEIIWFWTYDSVFGRVHSNDYIGLKYSPQFFGNVSTSQTRFLYSSPQNIYFGGDTLFGAPIRLFPRTANKLREQAEHWIDTDDRRLMTWIKLQGEDGIDIYQWPPGIPWQDSLVDHLDPLDNEAIFVDGQVRLEGVVTGVLTIGSSGDMWLMDNVRYDGANEYNGSFDEDEMENMLGLISEQNIIVGCTIENGKSEDGINDGWRNGSRPMEIDKHSIIINAALVALGESFTFENQNDDWAVGFEYVGPTPDERGIIHLKGAVIQYRRGYVHRSNHFGTGYGRDYHYDFRFDQQQRPPYMPELSLQYIPGTGNRLYLKGDGIKYEVHGLYGDAEGYDKIFAEPGTQVTFFHNEGLTCRKELRLNGSQDSVVFLRDSAEAYPDAEPLKCEGDWANWAQVVMFYTRLGVGVPLVTNADTIDLDGCRLEGGLTINYGTNYLRLQNCYIGGDLSLNQIPTIDIQNCTFPGRLAIDSRSISARLTISRSRISGGLEVDMRYNEHTLDHLVVEGGARLTGAFAHYNITNCDFVGSDGAGLGVGMNVSVFAVNCIFTGNHIGVLRDNLASEVRLTYGDCWDNDSADYIGVEPGEGSFSTDPKFVAVDAGDYHLEWDSPCIDAGDPDSPRDPDGTIADIGAFYFQQNAVVGSDFIPYPSSLILYPASPNPFNRSVTLRYSVPTAGLVSVEVYDLQGRMVYVDWQMSDGGENRLKLDGRAFSGAGIYFVRLSSGADSRTVKVVKLP
jgi:hypothetical protein